MQTVRQTIDMSVVQVQSAPDIFDQQTSTERCCVTEEMENEQSHYDLGDIEDQIINITSVSKLFKYTKEFDMIQRYV